MTCEKYRDALINVAAGNPLDRKLANHLESCTPCRTTLEGEQALFTAIDDALRASMGQKPRADFLAGLHAQIAQAAQTQDAQKQSGWSPMWAWAGAAALALVLVAMSHPWAGLRRQTSEAVHLKAATLRVHESPPVTQTARGLAENLGTKQHARIDSAQYLPSAESTLAKRAATPEPEVVVPPDEARAFALFVARVAGRDAMAEAVVRPAVEKAVERGAELPRVPSVDLADLQPNSLRWNDPIDESADSE
ncbi:MAG TPA: hypothetical protein VNY29_09750 [Terriglobales bacterium]|jgi:hypothetical protein|nr:hypothetical protein [Terriglobales bacterium]